jgi:hypothetical protein
MTSFAPWPAPRRHGGRVLNERVQGHEVDVAPPDGSEDTDRLEIGQAGAQLADHLHVVEASEARRADEGAALREAQDAVDLAASKIRPDLVRDRAQTLQGKEHVRELDPVRQLDRDDVSRSDAECRESRRDPVDSGLELGIGDAAPTVDDRDPKGCAAARADRIA